MTTTATQTDQAAPEAVTEFLRRLRDGMERGLDPLSAAERAAGSLPEALVGALEALARRLRGEYREDEWGFDEGFAEAVYPLFELLYDHWWRVQAEGATSRYQLRRRFIFSTALSRPRQLVTAAT